MKAKLGKSLAVSMATMILLSMMAIIPVHAPAVPEFYMDPSTNPPAPGPSLGFKWNVTVYVKDITDVYAWQVHLGYDATLINLTNIVIPPEEQANWGGMPVTFFGADYGEAADTKIGAVPGVTGAGPFKLVLFEFEIIKSPAKYETLSCALNINNTATFMQDSTTADISPVTKTDGTYEWAWVAPITKPHLAVVPAYVEFDQYTPANGSQFDIDVYIENLDINWAITNATFVLKYNTTVIDTEVANITINTADWDGTYDLSVTHGVPDMISITVRTTQGLEGDVLIATITFTVMFQGTAPTPYPAGHYDSSPLDLQDIVLYDHAGTIQTDPEEDGEVRVYALLTLEQPFLEVDPADTTLGPDLVIGKQFGKEFCVNVNIANLDLHWEMVGIMFRLKYDPELLEVTSITEGPYLPGYPNRPDEPFTFFISKVNPADMVFPAHVLVGDLILPDDNGTWTNFPGFDDPAVDPENGNGTLATICFKPLKQSWTDTYMDSLELFDIVLTDQYAESIGYTPPQNGTVTILPIDPRGRHIDLWMVDPDFGGQGLHEPANLVLPQMELNLTAKVTYNWWPVSYKKVTFEIRDPSGMLWAVLQDDTCDTGHAYAVFRMPWTGHDAESLLGVWNITVSVTLADVVITDWMTFHYDYLIRIWDVTTDKAEYMHGETVDITVDYGTHAIHMETVFLYVTVQDELGVPIGVAMLETTVGGSVYSQYKNYTDTVSITIPMWAYAGLAIARASFVSGLPSEGGEAVAQEVTTTFWILPVWDP